MTRCERQRRSMTAGLLPGLMALVACTRTPPAALDPVEPAAQHGAATSAELPSGAIERFSGRGQLRIVGRADSPVFVVELAQTAQERSQGLMYRRHLAQDAGMVFFMPDDKPQRFWMRNTLIPLDMIFVDSGWKVVGVVERVPPLTEQSRGVDAPSRYVVELASGQADRWHIGVGTHLELTPLPQATP